jgi:hypothetical protein
VVGLPVVMAVAMRFGVIRIVISSMCCVFCALCFMLDRGELFSSIDRGPYTITNFKLQT